MFNLQTLTTLCQTSCPSFLGRSGSNLLWYADWFALALTPDLCTPFPELPEAHGAAKDWRTHLPPGDGAYGQPVRDPVADNVKLVSDLGLARINTVLYTVISTSLPDVEFRVFSVSTKPVPVGIYLNDRFIGVVGPLIS